MQKKIFLSIILTFILVGLCFAEELTLTLDEAIAIALRDNRDILLSAEEVKKYDWKIKEAWSEALPALTFTYDRDETRNLSDKPYTTNIINVGLKQNIFKSGKILNNIKLSEFNKTVKEALLDKTKLDLALSVKKAFSTLILAEDFFQLNEKVTENTQQHLDFLKRRYQAGEVSESEILKAESSLESAKKILTEAKSQIEAAEELLRNLLYLDRSTSIMPDALFKYEIEEIIYDEAFLAALAKRPEIKQYEAQEKADQRSVAIARAGNLPTIYASLDLYSGERFVGVTGAALKWKNYSVTGITVSWPIFDGFATQSKINQALVDLKKTQLLKEKTIRDIALELKDAYLFLKNALSALSAAEADIALYEDNLKLAKDRFNQGIVSSLDLSDADLKYAVSEFNQKQAIYDYIIAKASFDKATGG